MPPETAGTHPPSLYHRLLGESFVHLPVAIQRMHTVAPAVLAAGQGTVTHGDNILSRALARLLRLPAAGIDRQLRVTFTADGDSEILSRHYPDATLTTRQARGGPDGSGLLREGFGPLSLLLRLEPSSERLTFRLIEVRWGRLRLSRWLAPQLAAHETAPDDWYRFYVRVDMPVLGRLIQYEGRLVVVESEG